MMCIYQVVHLLCTFLPEKAFFHVLFPKEKCRKAIFLVCIPSSRQLKKQKVSCPVSAGQFFMLPPAVSFHEILLVSLLSDSAVLV